MIHGQVFMNATLELQSAAAASLILKAHRGRKEKATQHWDLSTSDTQVNENLFCHNEEVAAGYTTLQRARAASVRKPTQKVQHCEKMHHLSSSISPVFTACTRARSMAKQWQRLVVQQHQKFCYVSCPTCLLAHLPRVLAIRLPVVHNQSPPLTGLPSSMAQLLILLYLHQLCVVLYASCRYGG